MIKFKSKLRSAAIIILVHLFRCLLDWNGVYGKIRLVTVGCMGHRTKPEPCFCPHIHSY